MEKEEISLILKNQRKFFATGATLRNGQRLETLKKLRSLIISHDAEIKDALWKDFHKPPFEVLATETGFVLKELNLSIRRFDRWSRPRRVKTPLVHFIAHSYVKPQPYGQVLILSPWNFPFQLAFLPLIGALAAGNCVVLKTSRQVPEINKVIEKILGHFPAELVTMISGDHSVSEYLLNYNFDYIFFTGSTRVGKYVMEKAAANLTPVSLELSGKNPCVVMDDAKLEFAVKRIAWGKFINAGQTCICPDYILVDRKIKERFLDLLVREIRNFYGDDPEKSSDFARIISAGNVNRLSELMKSGEIVTGGTADAEKCYVAPTVIRDVKPGDPVMQQEIFGPVLPVIDYEDFEEVYGIIENNPKPLAVYIFTRNKRQAREFLARTQSGSAAVNDTVMQIASPYLPYGGLGSSGIGRYHGKRSFQTFSNMRSVLVKSNLIDMWLRYPPYNSIKARIVSLLLR
ncbi:MAG TPA: aldehyde dehydrogenase family protein [Bacteroidales bacterium]|nr:aldehyde dehydrogenase family protein [Bacteroidales bacterium]